jgi:hypothetical protein
MHAYEMAMGEARIYAYEMHVCERHVYEMACGRGAPIRDTPIKRNAYEMAPVRGTSMR